MKENEDFLHFFFQNIWSYQKKIVTLQANYIIFL